MTSLALTFSTACGSDSEAEPKDNTEETGGDTTGDDTTGGDTTGGDTTGGSDNGDIGGGGGTSTESPETIICTKLIECMSLICTSTFDQAACEQSVAQQARQLNKQHSTQIAHASLSKKHSARTRKLKQPASVQKYHKVAVQMAKRVMSDFKTGHTFVAIPTVRFQPTLLFATSRIHVKKVHSVSLPHRVRLREAACRPANAKFSV